MKIVHILNEKWVEKPNSKLLMAEALKGRRLLDEPIYVVEMTQSEYQLISFYLELEKRKPIMNPNIKVSLKKESDK